MPKREPDSDTEAAGKKAAKVENPWAEKLYAMMK